MRSLTIQIPQPCHERWAEMQPTERGRFCASCQKTVVDYTALSDQELVSMLSHSLETSCGRFRNEQLNRPLQPSNPDTAPTWRHWLSLLTMGLFGWQTTRAQLSQTNSPARPASQTLMRPVYTDVTMLPIRSTADPDKKWVITGRVMLMDSSGNLSPVSNATLSVTIPYTDVLAKPSGERLQAQTDSTGAFSLLVPTQRQGTELTAWVSTPNHLRGKTTFTTTPATTSIILNDIILYQPAPIRDITGGGLMVIREPSRWQKLKRKRFGPH